VRFVFESFVHNFMTPKVVCKGSGKTYTMKAIYERAANELFSSLDVGQTVSASFFEIAGDTCSDLLNCFTRAQLMTAADGAVRALNLPLRIILLNIYTYIFI